MCSFSIFNFLFVNAHCAMLRNLIVNASYNSVALSTKVMVLEFLICKYLSHKCLENLYKLLRWSNNEVIFMNTTNNGLAKYNSAKGDYQVSMPSSYLLIEKK